MKRITLTFLFLLFFSSPSYSEWKKVASIGTGIEIYVNFTTIKKKNTYVHYQTLQNLKEPDSDGVLSSQNLWEVDCNIPIKIRSLSFTTYNKMMGQGIQIIRMGAESNWRKILSNSSAGNQITTAICEMMR